MYLEVHRQVGRDLDTLNFELSMLAKVKSIEGFGFGVEVVKNSDRACVFCIVVIGGASPPE